MISRARPSFWRLYSALDPRVKLAARRAYQLFLQNPEHPSLRFKKLQGYANVWSVRITEQYRAVGERDGDTIEWAWIGSHNEFDGKFGWRRPNVESHQPGLAIHQPAHRLTTTSSLPVASAAALLH